MSHTLYTRSPKDIVFVALCQWVVSLVVYRAVFLLFGWPLSVAAFLITLFDRDVECWLEAKLLK